MLTNTFCHIPLISVRMESRLWDRGIHAWRDVPRVEQSALTPRRLENLKRSVAESEQQLLGGNARYFADRLPPLQHWRMFPAFRHSVAYVDIETTGMNGAGDHITTIAVYDGKDIKHYVHGENLRDFIPDIRQYQLLVTYNGKCFDIPFIERYFSTRVNAAHIDLRYLLRSLGYSGGLKGCERQLGVNRRELDGVDGFFAVLLWDEYVRNRNKHALETLLAYNIQDVINLETLMVKAFNLKLEGTPFVLSHRISPLSPPVSPFEPHLPTIEKIRRRAVWSYYD